MKPTVQKLFTSLPKPVVNHIQHLERMRQDFVANVSHELRTPLTVLHGYIETLLEQDFDDTKPWKKIFTQMQQQTSRMESLIEDLLFLSRLESDNGDNTDELVKVSDLLTTICQEAKEFSGNLKHRIVLQADADILLLGSPSELRSLFSNIIFNAVKYTPERGNIQVEWYNKNNHACFKVTDTGIGIAKKHIPRLTERFYRVDPARTRGSGGTGLGLAIVKHVSMRHHAKLDIASKLGKGSVFACIFPKNRTIVR